MKGNFPNYIIFNHILNKEIKTMNLSFVERLSKIKKNNELSIPIKKPKEHQEKISSATSHNKTNDFQQHHSDLKSMLQMLEG